MKFLARDGFFLKIVCRISLHISQPKAVEEIMAEMKIIDLFEDTKF